METHDDGDDVMRERRHLLDVGYRLLGSFTDRSAWDATILRTCG